MPITTSELARALSIVRDGRTYTLEHFGNHDDGKYVGHTPAHEFCAAVDTLVAGLSQMASTHVAPAPSWAVTSLAAALGTAGHGARHDVDSYACHACSNASEGLVVWPCPVVAMLPAYVIEAMKAMAPE